MSREKAVLILGGGLAGIAAASVLAEYCYDVTLVERRNFLGGRAAAFPTGDGWLDNCQHVILGCCVNLLHLLEKLKTRERITFFPSIPFLENGKSFQAAPFPIPSPLHYLPGFLKTPLFSWPEKLSILKLFFRLLVSASGDEETLDSLTMEEWLRNHNQSESLQRRFWSLVLVSSLNETLSRMSAKYGVMVLREAFLASRNAAWLGTPNVTLAELYHEAAKELFIQQRVNLIHGNVKEILLPGSGLRSGSESGSKSQEKPGVFLEGGTFLNADRLISTLPFYNLLPVLPDPVRTHPFFSRIKNLETSPIVGIHLWFDRQITGYPFGALVDSPLHWFFVKPADSGLHYVQLVVSACRDFLSWGNDEIISLSLSELKKYLPETRKAALVKSRVVRETRATFSSAPGCDANRPPQATPVRGFYLAGDWTATGWPPTMEGAVRSGYRCAEIILREDGNPVSLLQEAKGSSRIPRMSRHD